MLVVVASALPARAATDAAGSGFGNGGWYWLRVEGVVSAIVPQDDGKILAVQALPGQEPLFTRLLPDGRLDVTFGKSGTVTGGLRVRCVSSCSVGPVAVQDGKIVIAQNSDQGSVLSRWLPDGSLDRTFGVRGRVEIAGSTQVSALAVAPDGAFVVALSPRDPRQPALLARYLADGRPDSGFGDGGREAIQTPVPVDLVVQSDGKIVVADAVTPLSRYLPDGSPDDSFGNQSRLVIDGFAAGAVGLAPDGAIVLAGITPAVNGHTTAVVKVLPNGQLEQQFGAGGVAVPAQTHLGPPSDVVVLPDGAVVVVGMNSLGPAYKFSGWLSALVEPDGRWKDAAAPNSCSSGDPNDFNINVASAIAVQPDGKVLIGGSTNCGAVVGRFTAAIELDTGARLQLAVLSNGKRLLRASESRSILHLAGAVQTSDRALITLSVQPIDSVHQCARRPPLQLQRGTTLGRNRLLKPALRVRSSTSGSTPVPFDAALPVDLLQPGTDYGIRLEVRDSRQRNDRALLRFTMATPQSTSPRSGPSLAASVRCHS